MRRAVDVEALLAPISDQEPSGSDLRYSNVYEEIKEARRFDDPLDQGEWKTDLKAAEWEKVISVASEALTSKTKDLQIAAWLTEALVMTEGFAGLASGLGLVKGLMDSFWESLYPVIEEDDLEYRMAPLEFMNEKLSVMVRQIPVTDAERTAGYSWIDWQASKKAGGTQDGQVTMEDFDKAMRDTSPAFYVAMGDALGSCADAFEALDRIADEKFGRDAPRLAELKAAIEDCRDFVQQVCKERGLAPSGDKGGGKKGESEAIKAFEPGGSIAAAPSVPIARGSGVPSVLVDASPWEQSLWDESITLLNSSGIKKAMERLLEASLSAPSVRAQNRMKLLLARLALQAGRYDLARPVLEQLNTLVEELHLQQWESPVWVADVLGSLYQCLIGGDATDEDVYRANELFKKLCTIDITRALSYKAH